MATGVPVDDQCIEVYNDLKLKKNYQYIIYKLSDDNKLVVVEKTAPAGKGGDAEAEYKAFIASLPQDDCRYAVYDFHFTINEGERNKILFYAWSPDTAKIKQKMVYAGSKGDFRKKFEGIAFEIQATALDELDYDEIKNKIGGKA